MTHLQTVASENWEIKPIKIAPVSKSEEYMKKAILLVSMLTSLNVSASASFEVTGQLKKINAYGGTSVYKIISADGSSYLIKKEQANKFGECKAGTYVLVADNDIKPRYYILLDGQCDQK